MGVKSILIFAFVCLCINNVNCAKILGLFPIPAKSHMNINKALMLELAERGHEVTVLSAFPEEKPLKNYRDIVVPNTFGLMMENFGDRDGGLLSMVDQSLFEVYSGMFPMFEATANTVLQDSGVQNFIHSTNETFDLIVYESFFMDSFMGFAHKFDCPIVFINSNVAWYWMGNIIGNPHPFAYVPDLTSGYTDQMTFLERVYNTYCILLLEAFLYFSHVPIQTEIMNKYFNYTDKMPSIKELEQRVSLVIVNSHFSLNRPRPNLPNLIEAAGLHIKESDKDLPEDIKKFIESAEDGVIYFSMGSGIRSAEFPENVLKILLTTFSKLKQKILWKWELDELPGKPENVKIGKWLPQREILAHPNVIAFITHGGLLSSQEAAYYGKPIVGIPIFPDQHSNIRSAERMGYALKLNLRTLTEKDLQNALDKIINDIGFREKVQLISKIFRDQPMKPIDKAVFGVEYVLRHKGAPHLRAASLDLAWYQYFLLDVIAVFLTVVSAVFYVAYYIIRSAYTLMTNKQNNSVKKHQ